MGKDASPSQRTVRPRKFRTSLSHEYEILPRISPRNTEDAIVGQMKTGTNITSKYQGPNSDRNETRDEY